jgi:hypothetical protein
MDKLQGMPIPICAETLSFGFVANAELVLQN